MLAQQGGDDNRKGKVSLSEGTAARHANRRSGSFVEVATEKWGSPDGSEEAGRRLANHREHVEARGDDGVVLVDQQRGRAVHEGP